MIFKRCLFNLIFGVAAVTPACGASEVVVARSGGAEVTSASLQVYLSKYAISDLQLTAPAYQSSLAGLKKACRDILAERYLADLARKRSIATQRETQRQMGSAAEEVMLDIADREAVGIAQIGAEELRAGFERMKDELVEPETVQFEYLFLRDNATTGSEDELMKRLQARATGGEDFSELRKELPAAPRQDFRTTEILHATRGKFAQEIEQWLFSTPPGDISPVFRGKYGWYIVKVHDRQTTRSPSFDEIAPKLRASLSKQKRLAWKEEIERRLVKKWPLQVFGDVLVSGDTTTETVIAQTAGTGITAGEIAAAVGATPPFAAKDMQKLREVLENLANRIRVAAWVKEQGWDRLPFAKALMEVQRNKVLASALLQSLQPETSLTEQQLRELYDQNPKRYQDPKEWAVRELFMRAPAQSATSSPAELFLNREGVRKQMEEVRALLATGQSAESIVGNAKYPPVKLLRHDLAPQGPRGHVLDLAVERLNVGEISPVTESRHGYHIFIVDQVVEPRQLSFEEARPKILRQLEDNAQHEAQTRLIEKAYEETQPTFNEDALRQFFETVVQPNLPVSAQ